MRDLDYTRYMNETRDNIKESRENYSYYVPRTALNNSNWQIDERLRTNPSFKAKQGGNSLYSDSRRNLRRQDILEKFLNIEEGIKRIEKGKKAIHLNGNIMGEIQNMKDRLKL